MPVARVLLCGSIAAAAVSAAAYPDLPRGYEAVYDVTIGIDDGLGAPLQGGYRERLQEVDGKVYIYRDRYSGNLKPGGFRWELGGKPTDTVSSIDSPPPGHFQRYLRTASGITYGLLEPSYRLSGKEIAAALPPKTLESDSFSCEIAGDRYAGEKDPGSGLLQTLKVVLATGGHKAWNSYDIKTLEGSSIPGRVTYDEELGKPAKVKGHYEYALVSFRHIDRLERDLKVDNLSAGSRVKDEIEGTVYEILGPGQRRSLGEVPKLQAKQSEVSKLNILLFVGFVSSGIAVLGLGRSSRSKRQSPPASEEG